MNMPKECLSDQVSQSAERKAVLEEVFRTAPTFLVVVRGPECVIEFANEAFFQLVGRRDLLGQPAFEALPEAAAGGYPERIARVMETREPFFGRELPVMLARTPGSPPEERLIDLVYLPLFEPDGTCARVLGHGTDVTEHVRERERAEAALRESEALRIASDLRESEARRTAEALRESEERFRLMADVVPQIVWITDAEGRSEFFNKQWTLYTGVPFEPSTAAGIAASFVHPEDAAATMEAFAAAQRTGCTFEIEHRIRSAEGTYRWFLVRAEPQRDPQTGEILRWFGSSTDIHDRKLTEAALRESEEKYRTLFASMDEGFCIVRLIFDAEERPVDFRYIEINPAFEQQTGMKEALGRSIRELVPDIEPFWLEAYGRVALTGEPTRFVDHAKSMGRWFDVYAFRTGEPHERKVAVLFNDITQRKQAEDAVREAARRKDEFLATLAHELRNPLAPIVTAVELLRLRGDDAAVVERAREIIGRQVDHLRHLVNDLLDVARITRGMVELRLETVTLAQVLTGAVQMARPLIDRREQELTVTVPPETVHLEGDLHRLTQVVTNLLTNAAKFTPEGGRIALMAERVGGAAVIRVRDTGKGIPAEMLPYIFDLFTQANPSIDRAEGGLGLGLTLVKQLVEMHGGQVEAHSAGPGCGSEFVVRLPLRKVEG